MFPRDLRGGWGGGGRGGAWDVFARIERARVGCVAKRLRLIRHPLLCSFHAIFSLVISLLHWPNSRF